MDTNQFMIYNDLLYSIYSAENEQDLNQDLLSYLRLLIPCSYASLLTSDPNIDAPNFTGIYCDPVSFVDAEKKYVSLYQQDQTQWMFHSKSAVVLKESDLLPNERRLQSAIYQNCYQIYNIYDSLQITIVYERKFFGVITLFRTKKDSPFNEEDISLLRSLGRHFNLVYGKFLSDKSSASLKIGAKKITDEMHLTRRETEILQLIYQTKTNPEICDLLHITDHTLQKHLQNIYRKLNISSRLELFQFCL